MKLPFAIALAAAVGTEPASAADVVVSSDTSLTLDLASGLLAAPVVAPAVMQDEFAVGGRFVVEMLPLGILTSSNIDIAVAGPGVFEEFDGNSSGVFTLSAGYALDFPVVSLEMTAGTGFLYNVAFTAPLVIVDVAARFRLGDSLSLGPHIAWVSIFEPSWQGFTPVTISDTNGWLFGAVFDAGTPGLSYTMAIDYFVADETDITVPPGYVATSTIDLSGFMVRTGFTLRF